MAGTLRVIEEKCTGCGACVSACPYGCITLVEGKATIDESCCQLCGVCISACTEGALELSEAAKEFEDKSKYKGVMVVAEQRRGKIHRITYELLWIGRKLADKLGEELTCVLIGKDVRKYAEGLVRKGADKVLVYDDERLEILREDPYADVIVDAVKAEMPSILLMGGTSFGRALAPVIAARLKTGLTADCTGLDVDEEGNLIQTRPAYGGNIMATIVCRERRPQMATVRYKVMKEAEEDPNREGLVMEMDIPSNLRDRTKVLKEVIEEGQSIEDAEIIVAGGGGIRAPEDFRLLEELANLLGGVVGASRNVVDKGWMPKSRQVGLSGKTVRPKLYIACGISGSVQHLAGMKNSEVIVAINKDPSARIFDYARFGVVGDLYEIVPEMIKILKEIKR
ncbi:MAG: electron transfer flavoprotein subunit alpha [Thermoproteota archaeon]|nr:MAG: electron transfer flavoprotein subunit alpha [Candidatus Korarchaeota archaeon]RLG49679.1 MAG: electron transfer flavoprotein subunit alpha [Candidatus Korarchaeota archaeon]